MSALPRASVYGASSQSSTALTRKNEKKQEYEAVAALDRLCAQLAVHAEGIANEADVLADGGVAMAKVLSNWPHIFRIINLLAKPSAMSQKEQEHDEGEGEAAPASLPRLVRIQVEDLDDEPE